MKFALKSNSNNAIAIAAALADGPQPCSHEARARPEAPAKHTMETYLLVELSYGVLGTVLERSHFCLLRLFERSSQRAVWMTMEARDENATGRAGKLRQRLVSIT